MTSVLRTVACVGIATAAPIWMGVASAQAGQGGPTVGNANGGVAAHGQYGTRHLPTGDTSSLTPEQLARARTQEAKRQERRREGFKACIARSAAASRPAYLTNELACERQFYPPNADNLGIPTPEQTYQDISTTITRYVPFPKRAVTVKPSPGTLINLDTTLTCSTANFGTQIFLVRAIGISAVPSKLTWHFGDGTNETVDVTSRPTQSIVHKYQHLGDIKISVTVQYEARVHVAGLDWRTLPDPVSIPGPTTPLHVSEITPQLTDGTYGH